MHGPFGWMKIAKGASVARWKDNHCSGKLSLEEAVEEAERKTS